MADSFIKNCYVLGREGDAPLFVSVDGTFRARLDGYVVIPKEWLTSEQMDAILAKAGIEIDAYGVHLPLAIGQPPERKSFDW